MALNLVYPLKKGTYKRVRGFASHVKYNPGTWYGIDDGCKTGTIFYAPEAGKVSHAFKQRTGGGWNFRFNITKYKGWFMWFAHCSAIPPNGKSFKRGQALARTGATGGVTGPHLHHSLMQGSVPRNSDNKNVVKWGQVATYLTKAQKTKICKDLLGRNCSSTAYKLKLTREGLLNRAYGGIAANFKRMKTAEAKLKSANAKVTSLSKIVAQQAAQLKTLAGQIQELQDDVRELPTQAQVDELREELKDCQEPPPPPPDTGDGDIEDPVKDIFKTIWRWLNTDIFGSK